MPDEPATKQDLREFEVRLSETMDGLESRLCAAIKDRETRILKAIYGCAETIGARLDAETRRLAGVEERLEIVERRVLDIEKRLNLPPAA